MKKKQSIDKIAGHKQNSKVGDQLAATIMSLMQHLLNIQISEPFSKI